MQSPCCGVTHSRGENHSGLCTLQFYMYIAIRLTRGRDRAKSFAREAQIKICASAQGSPPSRMVHRGHHPPEEEALPVPRWDVQSQEALSQSAGSCVAVEDAAGAAGLGSVAPAVW